MTTRVTTLSKTDRPSVSHHWCADFERASGAHHEVDLPNGCGVNPYLGEALRSSLPTFQLGESGTGKKLLAAAETTGDANYVRAVELFVAEEQEHARLLAMILDDLQEPLRESQWTDSVFVFLRHRGGLRSEVLILMVAEVVSRHYYGALRRGCFGTPAGEIFDRIAADEERHIAFHVASLPLQAPPLNKVVSVAAYLSWVGIVAGAAAVVWLEHGTLLRACGMTRGRFLLRVGRDAVKVGRAMFGI